MRKSAELLKAAGAVAVMVGALALSPQAAAEDHQAMMDAGKKLAFDSKKGNCLGCHMIAGGVQPGNVAPPLVAMKARYPDKAKLRAVIWDITEINPNAMMPPFGRHQILTEKEIDEVLEFIYSL